MSHFTRIKTQMVEKKYLIQALEEMGYSWEEGPADILDAGRRRITVEIKVPIDDQGHYLGFRKLGNNYEMIADWMVIKNVKQEDFQQQLLQRYAYLAARAKLEEQGFELVNEEREGGEQIRLLLRRVA